MATENTAVVVSLPVAADYSESQYLIVDVNSSGQAVLEATQGTLAVGVLQDNPAAAGRVGRVAIGGLIKVACGDTLAAGARFTVGADSKAEAVATGDYILGTVVKGGADGEVITVLWSPADISA